MIQVVTIVGTAAGLSILPVLWQLKNTLRATSLTTAWWWAAAAWSAWSAAWTADRFGTWASRGAVDQLWYAASISLLAPLIAVLGAKRPNSRVWGWFVLLPLVLVLGWPAAAAWGGRFPHAGWSLEEPVFVGFALVLLMGLGNYVGTRCTIPVLLWGVGLVLVVAPLWPPALGLLPEAGACRAGGTLVLVAAIWLAFGLMHVQPPPRRSLELVWRDFQNLFGIVWARRIQERFNATAVESHWPARLGPNGLIGLDGGLQDAAALPAGTREEMEHALRWLLRRFVDPQWIDDRCSSTRTPRDA